MSEPTLMDLMSALTALDKKFETKFEELDIKFEKLDVKIDRLDEKLEARFDDLAEAIDVFASDTEKRLTRLEETSVTKEYLEKHVEKVMVTKDYLAENVEKIMVTKEYLAKHVESVIVTQDSLEKCMDRKVQEFHKAGRLLLRMEDRKLDAVIDLLQKHKTITVAEAERLLAMEPFPTVG